MDVFGEKWENYTERLYDNWQSTVAANDTVIIPGDVSWATYIEDAFEDFSFINRLNGSKIILKGNHDYWWTTLRKMNKFIEENNFSSIKIIHNTAVECENAAVCGTRGWSIRENGVDTDENRRIFDREKQRLILSLEQAVRLKKERIIVGMHYPPIDRGDSESAFLDIMKNYGVESCVYGHLHSYAHSRAFEGTKNGVHMKLVSCDYINFTPILV